MHDHVHKSNQSSDRIGWAFALNVGFTIIEFVGGLLTNSTAIMADAVHDLGDSLSIGSTWVLNRMAGKGADDSFTYGYKRLSLLGTLINGIVLIAGSIWVLVQAIPRLFDPVMPVVEGMLGLAILGVVVNGFAANDVIANLGVIAAGVLVAWTGSLYPDLIIGFIIAIIVFSGAIRILRIRS